MVSERLINTVYMWVGMVCGMMVCDGMMSDPISLFNQGSYFSAETKFRDFSRIS